VTRGVIQTCGYTTVAKEPCMERLGTCVGLQRVTSQSLALRILNHTSASYVALKFFWRPGLHCSLLRSYLSNAPDHMYQITVEQRYLFSCSGHFCLVYQVLLCLLRCLSSLHGIRIRPFVGHGLPTAVIYIYIYIYIYLHTYIHTHIQGESFGTSR
jgi:hypothetical protein